MQVTKHNILLSASAHVHLWPAMHSREIGHAMDAREELMALAEIVNTIDIHTLFMTHRNTIFGCYAEHTI